MTLFTINNTKIKINLIVILLFVLWLFSGQISIFLIMTLTIFLHELFHAFVAKLFGFHTESIELFPFGGEAEIRGIEGNYIEEAIVASAGPLISLFLGFLWERGSAYGVLPESKEFVGFSYNIAMINLLPIYPLDGGRILMCVLKGFFGEKKGRLYGTSIGVIVSSIFFVKCACELIFSSVSENIVMAFFMVVASVNTIKKPPSIYLREKYWNNENVKVLKVQDNQKLSDVIKNFNGNYFYCVFVVDENGKISGILTEKEVYFGLMKDSTAKIKELTLN